MGRQDYAAMAKQLGGTAVASKPGGVNEPAFRSWYATQAKRQDLNPDPDDPAQLYDYRAAFTAGASPDAGGHWPSQFKRPGHPNEIVGGFNTRTGARVPGTPRASEPDLVKLGWDPATAKQLSAKPDEPTTVDYAALALEGNAAPAQPRTPGLATIGEQIAAKRHPLTDVAIGAAKGAGNTLFGMGKLVRDYTPVGRISDAILPGAFDQHPPEITPTNTAQRIGFTGEQVGEFLIPSTALTKLGKAGGVARSVAQTMAQTGSPIASGVSGAITAAIPGAGTAARASDVLRTSANKSVAQALGATKEWAKSDAAKLAPQMIARGVGGSRPAMLEQAKAAQAMVGQQLDDAYQAAAAAGDVVDGTLIRGALQLTGDALKVKNAQGALMVIPGSERVVKKLADLDEFVQQLGADIPIDRAAHIKRTMDQIVSKAGLFGQKATASATDSADAWAFREASGAFRELLNRNPGIAELNKEVSFWTGLKGVLKETEKRTQAQRGGITDAIRGTGGAVAGAMVGGPIGAGLGQLATQQLSKVLNSAAFKTQAAAPLKTLLADALASGHTGKVLDALRKISASVPAQAAGR